MKKTLMIILLSFLIINIYPQALKIKVVEKKGMVDVKDRDGNWSPVQNNDLLQYGTEIFTGYHSRLSIEIGKGSYITINQLSKIKIVNVLETKDGFTTNIDLIGGYVVIFAKVMEKRKNNILININKSNVFFENAGGEIFLRKDKGAIIKSFQGKLKIGSKLTKVYFIKKDEVCGILPNDTVLETDYFLKRDINVKANEIFEENKIDAYYELLYQPYSEDTDMGDYLNNFEP